MINEQLVWFIDGRYFYNTITLDKIITLATAHQQPLKIIIDVRVKSTERWYWHSINKDTSSVNKELATINTKKQDLLDALATKAIEAEVIVTQSADHITVINTELAKKNNSLLILEDTPPKKRHPLFQALTEINSPVLLLSNSPWKKPLNIIGAVDPLHENDRPAHIDDSIVKQLKAWHKALSAQWTLVHCCYISSVLYEYKNKVLLMHKEGLQEFAEQFLVKKTQYILLEGLPEEALKAFINKNNIDILCIGLVNRSMLDKLWVGSTTSHFLYEPPCDLLLIKQ
ncbi:universal stress protein [Colwellia ponticola]|uniref:Universal stress protein n=1 Tax=Colwellia ponticola TaxID=2304625 RepID=A0A8H2JJL4_9GAMM|nr:universal stress protein [Colwellia ponticola]TMM42517.1 universal stress protein [Colwellia ponticola]